ncbi:MAG: replication-relaxation family protein [Candidatus Dormibacteria bacterium]
MVVRAASHDPSDGQLGEASRGPSHVDMKGHPYSLSAIPSPGRTGSAYKSQLVTNHLELRPSHGPARSSADIWLTPRDAAILGALHAYRYLDRYQLQGLFFEGPRSCQYRLSWLADHDLVHAWRAVVRPGHVRRATIYLLSTHGARALADWRDDNPRIYVERADHAARRRHHIVHDLAANQFFVDLALAARGLREGGLYHWVGEHGVICAYAQEPDRGPIPDGWGRLLLAHGELLLHLEWDRGSEQTRRLHAKVSAYAVYFRDRPEASCNQVLFVAPTDERERQILGVVRHGLAPSREGCRLWTTTVARLVFEGPLGAIWAGNGAGDLVSVDEMPARPRGTCAAADSIARPGWWERRPGGGEGA